MQNYKTASRRPMVIAIGLCAGLLTACGGGSSSGGSNTTTASFSATDAPVDDVFDVTVSFNRIDLKPVNGDPITIDLDGSVEIEKLNELTGNAAEPIVTNVELEPGEYQWIRLFVDGGFAEGSYVIEQEGNTPLDLFIPGQQNANPNTPARFLHLNSSFTVPAGGHADFTIDFVLRKGLTKPNNSDYYLLRPAMRLTNNVEVGTISGTVADDVITSCLSDGPYTVYLYEGDLNAAQSEPGDIYDPTIEGGDNAVDETGEPRPITTASVAANESTGIYEYQIGFVREIEGGYSVAFTCDAANDLPETDDSALEVLFTEVLPVSVTAGETATADFSFVPEVVTEEPL
jgi:hypothetical protein